jgi:hypothetical protein
LPSEIGLIEAWHPNFGDCLFTAISKLLAGGNASAVVLNSDSPTLPTSLLVETAEVLARPGDRAVLGPSNDGGYYLLGLKHAHRRLFEDVDWSTDGVAAQTRARAREIDLEVYELPAWYDIDDQAAFHTLHGELFGTHFFDCALQPHPAPHTAALMQRMFADSDLAERLGLSAHLASDQIDLRDGPDMVRVAIGSRP